MIHLHLSIRMGPNDTCHLHCPQSDCFRIQLLKCTKLWRDITSAFEEIPMTCVVWLSLFLTMGTVPILFWVSEATLVFLVLMLLKQAMCFRHCVWRQRLFFSHFFACAFPSVSPSDSRICLNCAWTLIRRPDFSFTIQTCNEKLLSVSWNLSPSLADCSVYGSCTGPVLYALNKRVGASLPGNIEYLRVLNSHSLHNQLPG